MLNKMEPYIEFLNEFLKISNQIGIGHGANIIWHVTVHPASLCQFEAILTIMLGELMVHSK